MADVTLIRNQKMELLQEIKRMIKADKEGKKIINALIDNAVRAGCFQTLDEANKLRNSVEEIKEEKEQVTYESIPTRRSK